MTPLWSLQRLREVLENLYIDAKLQKFYIVPILLTLSYVMGLWQLHYYLFSKFVTMNQEIIGQANILL